MQILKILRDIVSHELPIYKVWNRPMITLKISSKQICLDICAHLKISPGKKFDILDFPVLATPELTWSFLRGYFDGDGGLREFTFDERARSCKITSESVKILQGICNFVALSCNLQRDRIIYDGDNCMTF
jgi:hypothetical protein